MNEMNNTEIEILKDLDNFSAGIYFKWRVLNMKATEMGLGLNSKYKFRKSFKELLGIDIFKRRIEIQEVDG